MNRFLSFVRFLRQFPARCARTGLHPVPPLIYARQKIFGWPRMQSGVVVDNGKLSVPSLVQKGLAISLVWYESVSFVCAVSPSVSCSLRSYRIASGSTPYSLESIFCG